MAIERTTLTATQELFPYSGIGELARDRSAIPRSELRFGVVGGALAVPTLGDQQQAFISLSLPFNFAHVIVDLTASVQADVAGEAISWPDTAVCNFFPQGGNYVYEIELVSGGEHVFSTGSGKEQRVYSPTQLPKVTMVPPAGQRNVFNMQLTASGIDGVAVDVDFFARFLTYDIAQANHYLVNSPQVIR